MAFQPSAFQKRYVKKKFDTEIEQFTEEVRVFKDRSDKFLEKIYTLEHLKTDLFKDIHAAVIKYDAQTATAVLQEYLQMIKKQELPWTQNYVSFIANHFLFITGAMEKAGSMVNDDVVKDTIMLLEVSAKVQDNMIQRVADTKEEIKTIEKALDQNLPLAMLGEIKKDEDRDEVLDG